MRLLEGPLQRRVLRVVEGVALVVEHEIEHRTFGEIGLLVDHEAASGDGRADGHGESLSCVLRVGSVSRDMPPLRSMASGGSVTPTGFGQRPCRVSVIPAAREVGVALRGTPTARVASLASGSVWPESEAPVVEARDEAADGGGDLRLGALVWAGTCGGALNPRRKVGGR